MRQFAQRYLDERKARVLALRGDVPDVPDLRAAIDARNAAASKNITGWRDDQRPAVAGPPRPSGSPFEDALAREVFDVAKLVEPPTTDLLRTAIDKARS